MNLPHAMPLGEQPTFGQSIDIYDGIAEKHPIKPSTLKDKQLWLRTFEANSAIERSCRSKSRTLLAAA